MGIPQKCNYYIKNIIKSQINMRTYFIQTFWCAMNQADSEKINMIFLQSGFKKVNNWREANVVIFNTCSVRQKWEDRVFWMLREIKNFNKSNNIKSILIWITWCMVRKTWVNPKYLKQDQKRETAKKIILLEWKDWIFNADDKLFPKLLDRLDFTLRIEETKFLPLILTHIIWENIWNDDKFDDYLKSKQLRENPASAQVIIQTWCDNYCTFCIVPYTRWREISRNLDDIVNECKEAVLSWAKEITLIWQNVNSYWKQFLDKKFWNEEKGKWNNPLSNFSSNRERIENFISPFRQVLNEINKIDWLDRIRFTSSNPHDMTKDILDSHFELQNNCNYLHFALQSWSNAMLKKMNRKHTYEDFKSQVEYLRAKDPLFSISTDIIVGFSWETEEMFEETVKAFRECEFDFAYTARYSVRTWTLASKLYPDDISDTEKARRWHILNDILLENIYKRNKMMLGRIEEVLISWQKDEYFYWRTRNFKEVFFECKDISEKNLLKKIDIKIWDIVKVKITELDRYVLKWKLIF